MAIHEEVVGVSRTSSASVSDGWGEDCGVTTGDGKSDSASAEEEEDSSVLISPIDRVHHFAWSGCTPGYPGVNTPPHC